jgi:hypothetical protein
VVSPLHLSTPYLQVWASYLAAHFVEGPEEQGAAAMGSLLQLLVGIASQQQLEEHSPTRSAAAAAVRALTSAALHLGWDKLYRGTPLLLQVCTYTLPPVWPVFSFHAVAPCSKTLCLSKFAARLTLIISWCYARRLCSTCQVWTVLTRTCLPAWPCAWQQWGHPNRSCRNSGETIALSCLPTGLVMQWLA